MPVTVTPLLQHLHGLSLSDRVNFKICVLVYRCIRCLGREYFSEDFRLVSEIHSRQRLRSDSSTDVMVPATRWSSLGDRAFPVAGAMHRVTAMHAVSSPCRLFVPATS